MFKVYDIFSPKVPKPT